MLNNIKDNFELIKELEAVKKIWASDQKGDDEIR